MPTTISNPRRRKIYAFIRLAPGLHLRALQRELDMPMGTLEHHLNKLEEMGKIVARCHERYKSYFPADHMSRTDRDYLYYLHQESPRKILIALLKNGKDGATAAHLTEDVGLSRSTVSHHVAKLANVGIVSKRFDSRTLVLELEEPKRVKKLLLDYPGNFLGNFGDWFRLAWGSDGDGEDVKLAAAALNETAKT